jgi:hypothetical protein
VNLLQGGPPAALAVSKAKLRDAYPSKEDMAKVRATKRVSLLRQVN